ncbi:hypothetical protein AOLI_G00080660 [Acnodon oligacanthus]
MTGRRIPVVRFIEASREPVWGKVTGRFGGNDAAMRRSEKLFWIVPKARALGGGPRKLISRHPAQSEYQSAVLLTLSGLRSVQQAWIRTAIPVGERPPGNSSTGVAALKLGHPTIAGRERQNEDHCIGMFDSHHMEDASKSHLVRSASCEDLWEDVIFHAYKTQ